MISKKILLLGEIGVGKTSLVRRFVLDEMPTDYRATMGVDLYRYVMKDAGAEQNTTLQLVIWDSDGSYGKSIFTHAYAKGTSGALIVGDVSRRTTLDHMVMLAESFVEAMPSRPFTFVLNKTDLIAGEDQVELPEALSQSRQLKIWTSALRNENVRDAFRETGNVILRREE